MSKQDSKRWEHLLKRTPGNFFYGVKTTGIFCRPDCSSRRPNRSNVQFFDTPQQAEAAGFRACKRCQPKSKTDPQADLIAQACRSMSEGSPSVVSLAQQANLSEAQFRRVFKCHTGLTPRQYAQEARRRRLRDSLERETSVTRAGFEAGYSSTGHLAQEGLAATGMPPRQFSEGAPEQTIFHMHAPCRYGHVLMAATSSGVCHIELGQDLEQLEAQLKKRFHRAQLLPGGPQLEQWIQQVLGFLEKPAELESLPLDLQGTLFQKLVWQALRRVPPGQTLSYSQLAASLGKPKASRAVAAACAANRVALAVPCHRVVGKNGKLTGYRWGVEVKRALLESEGAIPGSETPPPKSLR